MRCPERTYPEVRHHFPVMSSRTGARRVGSDVVTSLDQLTGRGVAAGGRIVMTAQSGHLVRAELDRDVLRLRLDTLADELTDAVNRALDDARAPIPAPDPHDIVDLEV